jgi:hypothetical protein
MTGKRRININNLPILLGAAGAVFIVLHWMSAIEGLDKVTSNPNLYQGKAVIVCGQLVPGADGEVKLTGGKFPLIVEGAEVDKVKSTFACAGGTLKIKDGKAMLSHGNMIVRPKIYVGWRADMIEWLSGFWSADAAPTGHK